jgi:hypothetical protein
MLKTVERCFVFVVCGSKEHIDTLHFSLKALKRFTKYPVIVVTDSRRNEIPVIHDEVLDIETPSTFNHHQASIWLKTSLHRILPSGTLYCYLDSDVIALNSECDNVFDFFVSPVTFAPDHTTASYFSPYAVNCDCSGAFQKDKKEFEQAISAVVNNKQYPPDFENPLTRELFRLMKMISANYLKLFSLFLKMIASFFIGKIKIAENTFINIRKKQWQNKDGSLTFPILLAYRKKLKQLYQYRFNFGQRTWIKPDGKPLSQNRCTHLHDAIKNKFGYTLENDWQHWNGGVFLFNNQSHNFMDIWHQYTMQIFEDSYWKIRDQGALIATVLHFQLTNHPTLPKTFNFIADFYKTEIRPKESNEPVFYDGNEVLKPAFIHIYHQWGNTRWDVWNTVEKQLRITN